MRPSRHLLLALCFVTAWAALGLSCKSKKLSPPEALGVATPAEIAAYGETLSAALQSCDTLALSRLIDLPALLRRGVRDSELPGTVQQQVFQELEARFPAMYRDLFCAADPTRTVSVLQTRKRGQRDSVLLVLVGEQGSNYAEFLVGTNAKGEVVSDDFYSYLEEFLYSEYYAERFTAVAADIGGAEQVERVTNLLKTDLALGLQGFLELPESYRRNRALMASALSVASSIDQEIFWSLHQEFTERYPDHPSLDLVLLDPNLLAKKHAGALAALDRLEDKLGKHDNLDSLRIGVLIDEGTNLKEAARLAEAIAARYPDRDSGYAALVDIYLATGELDKVAANMKVLMARFGYHFTDDSLAQVAIFGEFAASSQWTELKAWMTENLEGETL